MAINARSEKSSPVWPFAESGWHRTKAAVEMRAARGDVIREYASLEIRLLQFVGAHSLRRSHRALIIHTI